MRRPWPALGCSATENKTKQVYISKPQKILYAPENKYFIYRDLQSSKE
jgi:hypothetical protein